MVKVFKIIFLATISFFIFTSSVSAANVVINEFLANPTTPAKEWVEFYNPDNVDLTNYWLDDDISFIDDSGNSPKKSLSSLNTSNITYPYLEFSSFLNNSGDYVVLFSSDGSLIDQYQYTSNPGKDVSTGRSPDGTGDWVILSSPTPGAPNSQQVSSPTPTSSPSPTLSPTLFPTPIKGIYKINEVKDKNDNILSNVKIHIDGVYTHHYAPETLEFCDGCKCDTYVSCGFGSHTISLEKTGYENWSQTKAINPGDSYEVNPKMNPSSSISSPFPASSSTPVPAQKSTLTTSPTPLPNLRPKAEILATAVSLVLGERATVSSGTISGQTDGEPGATPSARQNSLPKILVGLAVVAILTMVISAFLIQKKKSI